MKVTIRVPGEDLELVRLAQTRGVECKLVRGGVIFHSIESDGEFIIPEFLRDRDIEFPLECAEEGGGMSSTGSATIICDAETGSRLNPFYIPRSGHLSCGTHAYFSSPRPVVSVWWRDRREDWVRISRHEIVREGDVCRIVSTVVWDGESSSLPMMFDMFGAAIEAAGDKANCYHCRTPHYIRGENDGV